MNTIWDETDDNFTTVTATGVTNAASASTNSDSVTALRTQINLNMLDIDSLQSPPHASISFQDSAFVLDLTQNAFSKVTNTGNDLFTVTDVDGMTTAGDTITVTLPGNYIVTASISFSGTSADVFEFAAFKNGVIASPKMERSTGSTDIGSASLPFYLESLVAGDDISLRMTNTASSDDATLVACSWVIWRLHE